jgi:hypothetical protein
MTSDLIIAALLLLGGAGAVSAATRKEKRVTADVDGERLIARANQSMARAWVARFMSADAPQALAEGLARWAGIESSGDPLARSKLGERGLLQSTEQSALREKPVMLTWSEWDALSRKETPTEQHAKIAMRMANWLWARAKPHVIDAPNDFTSALWYGKLYHQRPVDVRDAKMHGPALPMARELAVRWANDAAKMHRLRAANVVAWGVPTP